MDVKQVIVIRKDLNLKHGKSELHAIDAVVKIFSERMKINIRDNGTIKTKVALNLEMKEWFEGDQEKEIVFVNSGKELMVLKEKADNVDIPNALIIDEELTKFTKSYKCEKCNGTGSIDDKTCNDCNGFGYYIKGIPEPTCLAIGPDRVENIKRIFKKK